MGQPQQITLADPDCEVKLSANEVATLLGMIIDLIDSAEKDYVEDDPDMLEDVEALKVLRHKLAHALERG